MNANEAHANVLRFSLQQTLLQEGILKIGAALAIAAWAAVGAQHGSEERSSSSVSLPFKMPLGDDTVEVLSDGVVVRPASQVLANQADGSTLALPVNVFLIKTPSRLILVDTGAGALLGPNVAGRLRESFSRSGYRPEQVDTILLTHAHPDHIGGLSSGDAPLFANATVYLDRRELIAGDATPPAGVDSRRFQALQHFQALALEPYRRAGRLKLFDAGTTLLPGVRSLPAYGHSPGHTAYEISSRGKRLLLWGDVIHVADRQFGNTSLTAASDADPTMAVQTRKRLLTYAAGDRLLIGSSHIAFPGLGYVKLVKGKASWVAFSGNRQLR